MVLIAVCLLALVAFVIYRKYGEKKRGIDPKPDGKPNWRSYLPTWLLRRMAGNDIEMEEHQHKSELLAVLPLDPEPVAKETGEAFQKEEDKEKGKQKEVEATPRKEQEEIKEGESSASKQKEKGIKLDTSKESGKRRGSLLGILNNLNPKKGWEQEKEKEKQKEGEQEMEMNI